MAFEKIRPYQYICDTKNDLKNIPEKKMGVECFVIKEACEYKLMSDGEWIKQAAANAGGASGDIDLSDYATEQYVDNAIANIVIPETDLTGLATETYVGEKIAEAVNTLEIPSIEGLATEDQLKETIALINDNPIMNMFDEDPEIMASNPGSKFGIALNSGFTRAIQAFLRKLLLKRALVEVFAVLIL